MLVCPHCQFENPDTHKFCQKCGGSLAEKECPICGASVSFEAEYCPQCHTATGTVWRALITPVEKVPVEMEQLDKGVLSYAAAPASTDLPFGLTPEIDCKIFSGKYLDPQHRYRILEPLVERSHPTEYATQKATELEVRVLDCQPLQASPLEVCCEAAVDSPDPELELFQIELEPRSLPAIAQLYLRIQDNYPALPLPRLHDAWEQDSLAIVLLEERANLPPLLDFWRDEQVLPLQILHWLHEMIELWAGLQSEQCCHSLLVLDNLRVDEDYLICLQRLYPDRPDQPPTLKDLGHLWQTLFQQAQRTQRGDLAQLYSDLETGLVQSLDELRVRIEEIAATLQSELSPMPTSFNFPEPHNPFMIDDSQLDGEELWGAPVPAVSVEPTLEAVPQPPSQAEKPSLKSLDTNGKQAIDAIEPEEEFEDQIPTAPNEESYGDADDSPTIVLPMRLINLEDAGVTDIGRQRDHNEDCFSIQAEIKKQEGSQGRLLQAKGLYILCDGMGGHAGGEVASALAVETLQRYFANHWQEKLPNHESIQEAIHQANQAIYDLNQQNARSGSGRMGTTLVLVLIQDTEAAIAHVGDSRLYRFSRRRGLEVLTVDHEVGQREIQRGVEPAIAYARPDAYQLTQALGPRDNNFVSPDIRFVELNEDMVLLLCSDGLTDNNLLEIHWQTHLEPLLNSQSNLEQGVHHLVDLANQVNGHDNITAIAIRAKVRPNLDQFGRA